MHQRSTSAILCTVSLRAELRAVVDELLRRPEQALPLDVICEAIGVMAITSEEIGLVLDELEAEGRSVMESPTSAKESLMTVLRSARELKQKLGRSPTSREIAEHSGLGEESVRLGLLFATLLQR
jgi:hypothetical protein